MGVSSQLVGLVLRGRYELVRRLGRGGFAEVWLARDLHLSGKEVALKILRFDRSASPDEVERFEVEPQVMSRIRDPSGHIVNVTDYGVDDGLHYFVMEYVDGATLRSALLRRGRLPWTELLGIAVQLCDGIAVAHAHSIAHRDLKPENIMLVRRRGGPHVKVVDLGIAKVVEEQELRSKRSALIGTPLYMAPEVIATEEFAPSGYFIADIYAVGVILYEAITGFPPFCGEPAQVMYQKVVGSAPPMGPRLRGANVPAAFEALIMRSLERRPEDRPASMEALACELRDLRDLLTPRADRRGDDVETERFDDEPGEALAEPGAVRALPLSLDQEGEWSLAPDMDARFVVYAKHIRTHERGPHTLGMSRVPGVLPGRLRCTYSNATLSLKVDADDGRSALYLDAFQPLTRMEQLLLAASSPAQSFDVGHRRARVRRVMAQALRVSDGCVEALLTEPAMPLRLSVPPWVSTVVVLETFADDGATRHIECICLEHPT